MSIKSLDEAVWRENRSGFLETIKLEETSTKRGWFSLPFFVVMTSTPFPARTPQIEAAAASFSTVTVSISWGLIFSSVPSKGKLSTTIRGKVWPIRLDCPLMVRLGCCAAPLKL